MLTSEREGAVIRSVKKLQINYGIFAVLTLT